MSYDDYHLPPQAGEFVDSDGIKRNVVTENGNLRVAIKNDGDYLDDVNDAIKTTLVTTLSSDYDTIDIDKMSKGGVTVAHNAIIDTATSSAIDCRGFNAISLECAVSAITSGNWLVEILGCATTGGTYGNCYVPKDDGTFAQQKTPTLDANAVTTYYFCGIPNYVKIKATRTTDGTLTCSVTPMNI